MMRDAAFEDKRPARGFGRLQGRRLPEPLRFTLRPAHRIRVRGGGLCCVREASTDPLEEDT
jgi:hypothetical protein